MKQHEAEELLSMLPAGRTLFTYGKDWYAASLLEMGLRRSGPEDNTLPSGRDFKSIPASFHLSESRIPAGWLRTDHGCTGFAFDQGVVEITPPSE